MLISPGPLTSRHVWNNVQTEAHTQNTCKHALPESPGDVVKSTTGILSKAHTHTSTVQPSTIHLSTGY